MAYIRVYLNDVLIDQVEFNEGMLFIGREKNNKIIIDNTGVSSHHAMIEVKDNSFILTDNHSTNGVFVNGKKITRHVLKYWDEIQIYNYVLKFMAVSSLEDSKDPDLAQDGKPGQAGTMEVAMSDVQDLLKLREQKKEAYFEVLNAKGTQTRVLLKGEHFRIGRSRQSDLRTSRWFAPAIEAEIQRKADGYYLVPGRRGYVLLNGEPSASSSKLADGDKLRVRNLFMTFFHRLIDAEQ